MGLLSVPEAAQRLGVSERQVRALARGGVLGARRLGSTWLLEERDVTRRVRRSSGIGRVWAPMTAWAAVEILQGGRGEQLLDQPRRSRLRMRLKELTPAELHRLAEGRAVVRRYAAVPRARTRLTGLLTPAGTDVLTDPLVASRFGLAVIDGDTRLEGYFAGDRGALQRRLRLTSAPEGDVTIRYVTDDLSVEHLYGTDALTALDLMDSDDIRERAAGRDVLERLLGRV